MTWEPRPVPHVTPETERYWKGAAEGKLLIGDCAECGVVYHYPRPFCPDCLSSDVEYVAASGMGTIHTYSTITSSSLLPGWPEDSMPHILATIELEEGPRMISNVVESDPDDIAIDTRVEVKFVPAKDGEIAIPVFTPSGE